MKLSQINKCKGIALYFLIGLSALWMHSCGNKSSNQYEIERDTKQEEEEKLKAEMAEKVVELSFMDFKLGSPMQKCLENAKKNKEIIISKIDKGVSEMSIEFTATLDAKPVDCKVCSFQDTITSLIILSHDANMQGVERLYNEKYGIGTNPYGGNWEWMFKNGGIKIQTHTTTKERIQVKKGHEKLRADNLQNYEVVYDTYFDNLSITYNDFKQIEKVKNYEEVEKAKRDSIYEIKSKIREDSLNVVRKKEKEKDLKSI